MHRFFLKPFINEEHIVYFEKGNYILIHSICFQRKVDEYGIFLFLI